jgi:aspartate racemase
MKFSKKIGIIGGMGAAASARFYNILVKECQSMGAVKDSNFPEVIIHSIPTEGISELGIANEKVLINDLERSVRLMEREKVDFVLIACNTAHYFIEYLRSLSKIYIVDMVRLSVLECAGSKKVGLLSTRSTRDLGIYNREFDKTGINLILANEKQQRQLDQIIADITSGDKPMLSLEDIINEMFSNGAEKVILGCTELPLAYTGKSKKVLDAGENAIKQMLRL